VLADDDGELACSVTSGDDEPEGRVKRVTREVGSDVFRESSGLDRSGGERRRDGEGAIRDVWRDENDVGGSGTGGGRGKDGRGGCEETG